MNYHYIEFMLKEQRKDETELCERRRLLKDADHSRVGLVQKAGGCLAGRVRWIIGKLVFRNKRLDTPLSIANRVAQPEGKRI